jgi:S1-C subfamily serine protease
MRFSDFQATSGPGPQTKIATVLLAFLTMAVTFLLAERVVRRRAAFTQTVSREVTPRSDLGPDEQATIELFQHSSRSVVHVTTVVRSRRMFAMDATRRSQGTGSGFVWDVNGNIVTNFHVVDGANEFLVTFEDQTTVAAELVGLAPHKDLALLRVSLPASSLLPISIGTSVDLQVGQRVFAIGNPFGLDQTLTTGIISGLGREIRSRTDRPITDVVQTDAAINPGNSGGPLLDSAGRLIGVNTAIYSPSGANDGVGFAIPVDTVRRVIPQLVKFGRIRTPSLNVTWVSPSITRRLGLSGAMVLYTERFGAADRGGVEPFRYDDQGNMIFGDLIVAIDDRRISQVDDIHEALDGRDLGDDVVLTVVRGPNTSRPQTLQLNVVLKSE